MYKKKHVVFVCGGKDFQAMDKFYLTAKTLGYNNVTLVTDTIEGEGQKSSIKPEYKVMPLYIIDRFTIDRQSTISNIWRNVLKIIVLPLQVLRLRRIYKENECDIFHAVPIYYMLLCYLAGIRYIGTPQGSEILIRPYRSRVYKYFAKKAIIGADKVIVDSVAMKDKIVSMCGVESLLIKDGFNTSLALNYQSEERKRLRVLSVRGCYELYRIMEIVLARNSSRSKQKMDFIFPAKNESYWNNVKEKVSSNDKVYDMLARETLYLLMAEAVLMISIPASDSSPRSVYEAIFCGTIVAMTYSSYYEELPSCMRKRIFLVDINSETWFDDALYFAQSAVKQPYIPSAEALEMCDQNKLINKVIKIAYEL